MKIFQVSDIHLEYLKEIPSINEWPHADILCLCGDIGNLEINPSLFETFLQKCKEKYSEILLIPGNHEYYQSNCNLRMADRKLQDLCESCGVHFLNCSEKVVKDIRFIGCTLWSIPSRYALGFSKDFHLSNAYSYSEDIIKLHKSHVSFLQEKLNQESKYPTVVMTHHLPSKALIHKRYENHQMNSLIACEIISKQKIQNVRLWLFGHSHERVLQDVFVFPDKNMISWSPVDSTLLGNPIKVTFSGNPIGYEKEKRDTTFDLTVFEI